MPRKVLLAAGAVGMAATVGFVMQAGQPADPPELSLAAVPEETRLLTAATVPVPTAPERIEISDVMLTSSMPEDPGLPVPQLAAPTAPPALQAMPPADDLPGAAPVASITQVPAAETAPAEDDLSVGPAAPEVADTTDTLGASDTLDTLGASDTDDTLGTADTTDTLGAPDTSDTLGAPDTSDTLDTADRPDAPAPAETDSAAGAVVTEAPDCEATLGAEATIAALVTLSFRAPCAPYTRVTFGHGGMEFAELTDSDGRIDIAVPALAEDARFTAILPDGEGAEAVTKVDSLMFYDRAVLQTTGPSGLTLHALECGAGYDEPGHVWSGAPRDPAIAARGEGGFLLMLGDPALEDSPLAQVYTFPSATSRTGGEVALSLEAEVLRGNCGREVTATVTQVRAGETAGRQALTIPMPGCDAVGDFLLLKTPLNDLKIASR